MPTEVFTAGVQYDDWKGTSAADSADESSANAWLEERGYAGSRDVLVGMTMTVGENHGRHEDPVYVDFLLLSLDAHPDIQSKLKAAGEPVEVKRVQTQMTAAEFLGLFKRLEVHLSLKSEPGGSGILDGREVVWIDQ